MSLNIIAVRGYYEVYTVEGDFLFSADTRAEALEEISCWEEEQRIA